MMGLRRGRGSRGFRLRLLFALALASCGPAIRAAAAEAGNVFVRGEARTLAQLPDSPLRRQVEALPAAARAAALQNLAEFTFHANDLASLRADRAGGIFYVCEAPPAAGPAPASAAPANPAAAVPVGTPPAYHSRPGATRVLYLDFNGHDLSGSAWGSYVGRAFDLDGNTSTFSDAEQTAMRLVWQRVSEDYAPFDVDVTTENPAEWGPYTCRALVTHNVDASGQAMPASFAGGVAYVGVFGRANFSYYSPALIYYNNLSYREDYIAEVCSHETGHNFGLSHDGQGTTEYYRGHGTGDISWGPIMGSGYGRAVSQWSRGEYYLASLTEDDLSILTSRIPYRADDHGDAAGAATPLAMEGEITVSTTNTANWGVVERNTDVDVFSFRTGAGAIALHATPFVCAADTRGGNLDLSLELLDVNGEVVASANPDVRTYADLNVTVASGTYYLSVRGTGAGTPLVNPPSGYTAYGSLGQYFISGSICPPEDLPDESPPTASLARSEVAGAGGAAHALTVTYRDNRGIRVSTLDPLDLRVTGPNGFEQPASFVGVNVPSNGTPRVATYAVSPPGGQWDGDDNGTYNVWVQEASVSDTGGLYVAAGWLGEFYCRLITTQTVYEATMDSDPGWTLEGLWMHGRPTSSSDPTNRVVIGYNITGDGLYPNGMATTEWATTVPVNCTGRSSVWLSFLRHLALGSGDRGYVQVSGDGLSYSQLYSSPPRASVEDSDWVPVTLDISDVAGGQPGVRVRWGMGPTTSGGNAGGWNVAEVRVTAIVGMTPPDTNAPTSRFSLPALEAPGAAAYDFSVVYEDNAALSVASIGADDIGVSGPNGYSALAACVGVSAGSNGSPRTAFYQVPAPGGRWGCEDNGSYAFRLSGGAVCDTSDNFARPASTNFAVDLPITNGPGTGVVWQRFDAVAGSAVADLTSSPRYPASPDASGTIGGPAGAFAYSAGLDSYGTRVRGLFVAPVSGPYYFYITADDSGELWVSTNDTPERATLAAYVTSYTAAGTWNTYGSQKSRALYLSAGARYYLEARHKESAGDDHIQVGVELPNGALERPIPWHRLEPWVDQFIVADAAARVVPEGGTAAVQVRLAARPARAQTVRAGLAPAADADFYLASGTNLVFDAGNWDAPQAVVVGAREDADGRSGQAILRLSLAGAPDAEVSLAELDNDVAPPLADNAGGATDVGVDAATLRGNLTAGGSAVVRFYWGRTDGGTRPEAWEHAATCGAADQGPVALRVEGLARGQAYWYRCYATNVAGVAWAAAPVRFCTLAHPFQDWRHSLRISFGGYTRPEVLTNFPALVVLSTNVAGFAYDQFADPAGGGDLRFLDAGRMRELNYEVDEWQPAGRSLVWVQVPGFGGPTNWVWAYWGNPAAAAAPAYTTNGSTWSADYGAVWHLGEGSGAVGDSAAGGNSGTPLNGLAQGLAGAIGRGAGFDGTNDCIQVASAPGLQVSKAITISAWFRSDGWTSEHVLLRKENDYRLYDRDIGAGGPYAMTLKLKGAGDDEIGYAIGNYLPGRWYHIAATYDRDQPGDNMRIYTDGRLVASKASPMTINITGDPLFIGSKQGTSYFFDGLMDEVRLSRAARSSNWVWACWANQSANAAFAQYAVVPVPPPDLDRDGMPDLWESGHGLNPSSATDAAGDLDGDRFLNYEEYIAGTDPHDPDSRLIVAPARAGDDGSEILFPSRTSRVYVVEYAESLLDGVSWRVLTGELNGTGAAISVTDTNDGPWRVYRVRVEAR